MRAPKRGRSIFRLILIKPSHSDDDGHVIQWLRSPIPANSLACLDGLARDCRDGVPVGIGGFHVSGTLAMLPNVEANVQAALDIGAFVYAGEAEEGWLER